MRLTEWSGRVRRRGSRRRRGGGGLRLPVAAAAGASLALLGAAGAAPAARHPGTASEPLVQVTEQDFSITAPRTVRAGDIRLSVGNRGPEMHELIVVHAAGQGLPLRPDGLTVDEQALRPRTLLVLEPRPAGTTREEPLHLAPGRYVLFCNMAGHYLGGMHAALLVR